jgi:hypothetical protein
MRVREREVERVRGMGGRYIKREKWGESGGERGRERVRKGGEWRREKEGDTVSEKGRGIQSERREGYMQAREGGEIRGGRERANKSRRELESEKKR